MLCEICGPGVLPNQLGMRLHGSNGIPQIMAGTQQELAEILVGYPAILSFAGIEAFGRIELRHEGYRTTNLSIWGRVQSHRFAWELAWRTFSTCRVETVLDTGFHEWPGVGRVPTRHAKVRAPRFSARLLLVATNPVAVQRRPERRRPGEKLLVKVRAGAFPAG